MAVQLLKRRFVARADQLREVREWIRNAVLQCNFNTEQTDRIVIGVNEACMNIIEHAYRYAPGDVVVAVVQHEDTLEIVLRDFAAPMDVEKIRPRPFEEIRPGGLGVHFMREVMDEVTYRVREDGEGNEVTMIVRRQTEGDPHGM